MSEAHELHSCSAKILGASALYSGVLDVQDGNS
jgi:hypothetical protein